MPNEWKKAPPDHSNKQINQPANQNKKQSGKNLNAHKNYTSRSHCEYCFVGMTQSHSKCLACAYFQFVRNGGKEFFCWSLLQAILAVKYFFHKNTVGKLIRSILLLLYFFCSQWFCYLSFSEIRLTVWTSLQYDHSNDFVHFNWVRCCAHFQIQT